MDYERLPSAPYAFGRECVSVAVDPTGTALLTATIGGAFVRRLADGAAIARVTPQGSLRSASFAPDGVRVVVANREGALQLFDGPTGAPASQLASVGSEATCVAPARNAVFAASQKRVVELDGTTLAERRVVLAGPLPGRPTHVLASPEGATLYVACQSDLVAIDLTSGANRWIRRFEGCTVGAFAGSPDGSVLIGAVAGAFDGLVGTLASNGGAGPSVAFPPPRGVTWAGESVATSAKAQDAAAEILAKMNLPASSLKMPSGPAEHNVSYTPVPAISPDGSTLAVSTRDGRLAIVDARTVALRGIHPRRKGLGFLESLVWLGDSQRLVVGCADGVVSVVTVDGRTLLEFEAAR